MSNTSAEILKNLKKDIEFYNDSIKEVAFEIVDNKVSKYKCCLSSYYRISDVHACFFYDGNARSSCGMDSKLLLHI